MDIKSKFIYFTKPKETCDIISKAFDQKSCKFAEDNKYGIYYWFNYYSDIFGRMLPHVFEVIYVLVKKEEGKQYPVEWFEDMKELPAMRIRIAPASEARSIFGGSIVGSDTILVDFYKGVDMSDYDQKIEEWKKKTMTLDEAIQHCEEKALCGDACGLEHKQLAEWLKELKGYRMDEETKLDKTTVTNVLEKLLNTIKDDLEKIRNADDTSDFSVEYSGINDGQRFSGKKFFETEKDAEDEMEHLMYDEKNDTISIHMCNHTVKSFTRRYR